MNRNESNVFRSISSSQYNEKKKGNWSLSEDNSKPTHYLDK